MLPQEASEINQFLSGITGVNAPHSLFVDNLHCPYWEFHLEYILPSCSTTDGVDYGTVRAYLEAISSLVPELVSGSQILPEPRPKKDIGKIFLVREMPGVDEQRFLWILALDVLHLGGQQSDRVIQTHSQGRTISTYTNRIYFSSKIIPVESIIRQRNEIRGFDPYEMVELVHDFSSGRGQESWIRPYSELFDDQDFTKQEEALRKIFNLQEPNWRLGTIYQPIGMDYRAISLRLLESRYSDIESVWNSCKSDYWKLGDSYLRKYLSTMRAEKSLSPSGNFRWQIFRDSGESP